MFAVRAFKHAIFGTPQPPPTVAPTKLTKKRKELDKLDAISIPSNQTTSDKETKRGRGSLERNTNKEDGASRDDGCTTTEEISKVTSDDGTATSRATVRPTATKDSKEKKGNCPSSHGNDT